MKLALGSVQFGLAYGAFNAGGQVPPGEVAAIIGEAVAAGVDTIDTARAYGASEAVLGAAGVGKKLRVVTKIAPLTLDNMRDTADVAAAVRASLAASRAALGLAHLPAVMFHHAEDLAGARAQGAWAALARAKDEGEVGAIGCSTYDGETAEALAARFPLELVQLPVSLFDRRAIASGTLARLRARGVEIHARSLFLQGFALANPDALPPALARHRAVLVAARALAAQAGMSPLAAALAYVRDCGVVDRMVVGVESVGQWREILAAYQQAARLEGADSLAIPDPALLNPALWTA